MLHLKAFDYVVLDVAFPGCKAAPLDHRDPKSSVSLDSLLLKFACWTPFFSGTIRLFALLAVADDHVDRRVLL